MARHPYKDETGQVLFYNLRLLDKNTGKKIILPLSYGSYGGNENDPKWGLKSYQTKNTLYNLDLLSAQPQAKVLIVEGEKTADAANQMFVRENIIAITWMGGSGAVNKTDWTPLMLRDIIIWPDNDAPGQKACNEIVNSLRRVGFNSLKVVSKELLQREFPEKWDLADPTPENRTIQDLRDLIFGAPEKGVGITELCNHLRYDLTLKANQFLAREVLWRVEERMRFQLEEEFGGKSWEIHHQIITESAKILSQKEFILDGPEELIKPLAIASAIYQAKTGHPVSDCAMKELRRSLSHEGLTKLIYHNDETHDKDMAVGVVGRHLGECLNKVL